jgi:hypothetical protein
VHHENYTIQNTALTIDPIITEEEYIKIRSLVLKKVEHGNNSTLRRWHNN